MHPSIKGNMVYGTNASDKSNLIKVMRFGREVVVSRVRPSLIYKKYFANEIEHNIEFTSHMVSC